MYLYIIWISFVAKLLVSLTADKTLCKQASCTQARIFSMLFDIIKLVIIGSWILLCLRILNTCVKCQDSTPNPTFLFLELITYIIIRTQKFVWNFTVRQQRYWKLYVIESNRLHVDTFRFFFYFSLLFVFNEILLPLYSRVKETPDFLLKNSLI